MRIRPAAIRATLCHRPRRAETTNRKVVLVAGLPTDCTSCDDNTPCAKCAIPKWANHLKCNQHLKAARGGRSCTEEDPCHGCRVMLVGKHGEKYRKQMRRSKRDRTRHRERRLNANPVESSSDSSAASSSEGATRHDVIISTPYAHSALCSQTTTRLTSSNSTQATNLPPKKRRRSRASKRTQKSANERESSDASASNASEAIQDGGVHISGDGQRDP